MPDTGPFLPCKYNDSGTKSGYLCPIDPQPYPNDSGSTSKLPFRGEHLKSQGVAGALIVFVENFGENVIGTDAVEESHR